MATSIVLTRPTSLDSQRINSKVIIISLRTFRWVNSTLILTSCRTSWMTWTNHLKYPNQTKKRLKSLQFPCARETSFIASMCWRHWLRGLCKNTENHPSCSNKLQFEWKHSLGSRSVRKCQRPSLDQHWFAFTAVQSMLSKTTWLDSGNHVIEPRDLKLIYSAISNCDWRMYNAAKLP